MSLCHPLLTGSKNCEEEAGLCVKFPVGFKEEFGELPSGLRLLFFLLLSLYYPHAKQTPSPQEKNQPQNYLKAASLQFFEAALPLQMVTVSTSSQQNHRFVSFQSEKQ